MVMAELLALAARDREKEDYGTETDIEKYAG